MKTSEKEITGYLIDPETKTITEIKYTHTLNNVYALLGCRLVDRAYVDNDVIYLDDEGLLISNPLFYCIDNERIYAGKSLLLGHDPSNETTGLAPKPFMNLAEAKERIKFLSLDEVCSKLDI